MRFTRKHTMHAATGPQHWTCFHLILASLLANHYCSATRRPLLTSDVPEVGTDFPSAVQPNFDRLRVEFEGNNPEFSWGTFEGRARLIFDELQAAWSTLNWERARPHETDNLFQMHQYWIEAYKRQHLRNPIEDCAVAAIQPVKLQEDAFYQGITLRIWAQGRDYTVDENGHVVSGSKQNLRRGSDYWTCIRNGKAKHGRPHADVNGANWVSPLKINAAGIAEYWG